jgi:enediyne biosynthesis protein CalE5
MSGAGVPPEIVPYERYGVPLSAHLTDPLLRLAPPVVGGRALDVACGTGLVARRVAPAVGPRGRTLGVDLSPAMVEAARVRAAEAGLRAVGFAAMDAQQLALAPASVDVAYCQLGLMLMADPARAAAELVRVVRPSGRVAAAVWGAAARVTPFAVYLAAVRAAVPGARPPEAHAVFRLGAPGALAALLHDAGLTVERDERYTFMHCYADAAEYWTWASTVVGFAVDAADGPAMRLLAASQADVQAAVRAEVLARLARYEQPDGTIPLPAEGMLVCAYR